MWVDGFFQRFFNSQSKARGNEYNVFLESEELRAIENKVEKCCEEIKQQPQLNGSNTLKW